MLTIWRRHTATCPHIDKGRDYLKCDCPLWADGYVNGKRTLRQSLKTRDMARARKRAVALDEPGVVSRTLPDAITAFLVNCQHLNANTQRKYRNRLEKQLLPFCEARGIDQVSELTVEILDEFWAGRKLAVMTSARELDTLRQFLAFCMDRKWIADNPARRIKTPRNARPEPVVPCTDAEIEKMLEAAGRIGKTSYERSRACVIVMLLRYCALRISDIAMLERSRIQDGSLLLYTRKTSGLVMLPLPSGLVHALRSLPVPHGADPQTSAHFFINGSGSQRTAVSVIERCLRSVFKLSGVKDAHAHRFRHTLATKILASGGSMRDVADVLGISESIAERHYAKWNQARQDRISHVMQTVHLGTKQAQRNRLAVIR
jgi:site-specific recombinase XerD